MRALSFRSKMLIAMMLVVAGVTSATLWVSQRVFQNTFESQLSRQFDLQSRAFVRQQQILLNSAKQVCVHLAGAVRIQHGLAERADDPQALYQLASDEFLTRDVLPPQTPAPGTFRTTFFSFLNFDGDLIAPPAHARPGLRPFETQPALREQLIASGRAAQRTGEPVAGYVTPAAEIAGVVLQQVVVTPIIDAASDEPLGALIVGFPAPEFESGNRESKTGIIFASRLFSTAIPQETGETVAEVVMNRKTTAASVAPLLPEIHGEPHRLLYDAIPLPEGFAPAYFVVLVSLRQALAAQSSIRRTILLLGGIGIGVALVLSSSLAHSLSVPIRELVTGTAEIQRGNFDVRVAVRSGDEIGQLTQSFNEMAEGLALKEKYRSVLNMVADKNVAQELIHGGVVLGGETRHVSVLFCDIRGFTPLTQNMDPARVIAMLNEHFTPLTRVVYEHGGVVDKFVGDLIMAIFGAPRSSGRDARNAVETAVEMIRERRLLNHRSPNPIEIGIGIASGPAVAGCMGSRDRLNYTVLGERVNLASRLCGKAGRMEIFIDEGTRIHLGDSVAVQALRDLELKGFSGCISAYKLLPNPNAASA